MSARNTANNAAAHPVFQGTADAMQGTPARILFADITAAGVERVKEGMSRRRVADLQSSALAAAAGIAPDAEPTTQRDPETTRIREVLVKNARTTIEPERLYPMICAGVHARKFLAKHGRWLAQEVANEVCRLAVDAYIERKQALGLIEGFTIEKDDTGLWVGLEATNTDDGIVEEVLSSNRSENPFSVCDQAEVVAATYTEWYRSIEVQLAALAGASVGRDGNIMQYGPHCRWVEEGKVWRQIVETFEQRVETRLQVANDMALAQATAMPASAWQM